MTSVPATPLTSYGIFERCIQRARNLIKLHEAAHGKQGKPEKFTADAHRAAIVLAISALDAFVRDLVLSRVRTLLSTKTVVLPTALTEQIKRFLKDDALLDAARKDDLVERVDKAFRSDFEKRSFQGTKVIEEQLQLVGEAKVFHKIAVKAHVNEDVLQRRHMIAHRGDYNLNESPPTENVITKRDAEDCIKLVCLIAKHMNQLEVGQ
jgi:hypothetical protein